MSGYLPVQEGHEVHLVHWQVWLVQVESVAHECTKDISRDGRKSTLAAILAW